MPPAKKRSSSETTQRSKAATQGSKVSGTTPRSNNAQPSVAKQGAWGDRIPPRQAQREIKEEVLYETAARLFNKHGYHGTSLSDLAKDLGISKAAIYNYVADKRELLYGIHLRSLDAARDAQAAAAGEKRGLDKVRKAIFNYVSAITVSPTITFILLEDGALSPEQAEEVLAARSELDHQFRGFVAAGVRDKSIAPCDPQLISFLITGGLAWISKWFDPNGAWSGDQVAEAMSVTYARMLSGELVGELPTDVAVLVPAGGLSPLPLS